MLNNFILKYSKIISYSFIFKEQNILIKYYLKFFLFLPFFYANCSTSTPYRLGELVPSFQKYEDSKIDPQLIKNDAVLKVEIGIKKYDDFFLSAKKLIIKIKLAIRVISISKTDPEFLDKNSEMKSLIKSELLTSTKDLAMLIEIGESISKTVKDDFKGINATKIPKAINEITNILTELNSINKDIKLVTHFIDSKPEKFLDSKNTKTSNSDSIELIGSEFEEMIKQLVEIEIRNNNFAKYLKKDLK